MKGIGKIIVFTFAMGFFFVMYVYGQVSLLHVSYQIESKMETSARLQEEYRKLKFEVDQLKAPRLLENKMKQHSLELTLPQEIRVVRMPAPVSVPPPSVQKVAANPLAGQIANFFGKWIDVAQAKTDN